jgi:hypothetical protein
LQWIICTRATANVPSFFSSPTSSPTTRTTTIIRNNLVRDPTLAGIRAELGERLKRRMRHAGESEPGILPAKDA